MSKKLKAALLTGLIVVVFLILVILTTIYGYKFYLSMLALAFLYITYRFILDIL